VYPGIRARYATNNEGAAATWFKIPGTAAQPSLADIEAGKVSGDELRLMITTNLTKLKSEGIFQNLAPVVDVATKAGQEKGRMFMTQEKADAYLKVYLEVAKEVGSVATVKHFAGGMTNGNTNTQEVVKTASYAELEKSGQLKPYALLNVKDNKHWAMMSSATTEGWPDAKLDNKQQSIFNPAAYAALNKLTGGNALIVTDAIGPNVAALKGMAVEKAIVNAWKAGANMALVSAPDTGKTISQQVTAGLEMTRSALQSGELKLDAFNESYLRIIGNKGLNACNVLKSYDEDGYAALIKSSPVPAPAATTAPVPPVTGTPTPGKSAIVSEKPTATATTTK
jgi:beta-glucosidase-like glycosyl hydrolase